jgi:hypothetical protein
LELNDQDYSTDIDLLGWVVEWRVFSGSKRLGFKRLLGLQIGASKGMRWGAPINHVRIDLLPSRKQLEQEKASSRFGSS